MLQRLITNGKHARLAHSNNSLLRLVIINNKKQLSTQQQPREAIAPAPAAAATWKPFAKLKAKAKEYGPFFFVYYSTVYVSTGAFIYGLFYSGVASVDAVKMKFQRFLEYIEKPELFKYYEDKQIPVKWETLGFAVFLNEIIEPVRFPAVVLSTPVALAAFRKVFLRR